jgi:hypothetical protein
MYTSRWCCINFATLFRSFVRSNGCVDLRYHRFKRIPLAFVGSDAVTMLVQPLSVKASKSAVTITMSSREHAVFMLQHMIDAGLVTCVIGDGAFHDNSSIYRSALILESLSSLLYLVFVTAAIRFASDSQKVAQKDVSQ